MAVSGTEKATAYFRCAIGIWIGFNVLSGLFASKMPGFVLGDEEEKSVTLHICLQTEFEGVCNASNYSIFMENIDTAETRICGEDVNGGKCLTEGMNPKYIFAGLPVGRYRIVAKEVCVCEEKEDLLPTDSGQLEWIANCDVFEILKPSDEVIEINLALPDLKQPSQFQIADIPPSAPSPDRFLRAAIHFGKEFRDRIQLSKDLMDTCTIGDLPRVGDRNLDNMLSLSPHALPIDGALGDAVSIRGQRSWFAHFDADGAEFSNLFFGGPLGGQLGMNTESVREFEVLAPGGTRANQGFGPSSVDVFRLQNAGFSGLSKNIPAAFADEGEETLMDSRQQEAIQGDWEDLFQPAVPLSLSRTENLKGLRPFGGGGNRHCRLEPCPYFFIDMILGQFGRDNDLVPGGSDSNANTFPAGEATDFSRNTLEFFIKKTFADRRKDPEDDPRWGRLTTAFQFALLGNPAAGLIQSQGSRPAKSDRLLFHTSSWYRKLGAKSGHNENRFWYSFSNERRLSLDGVFDPDLGFFLAAVGSETDDNFNQFQLGDSVTLFKSDQVLQFGANFVSSHHRRLRLDVGDRRVTRLSNQSIALFSQIRKHLKHRLTLTAGLRWEGQNLAQPLLPPSTTVFAPFLAHPEFPSDGQLPDQWNQWQPRLALAWSSPGGLVTLRGGVGRFFARQTMLTQLVALEGTGRAPQAPVPSNDVAVFSRDYRNPRIDAADFSIELRPSHGKAFSNTVFSVDFRYARGKRLTRFFDLNQSGEEPLDDQEDPRYRLPERGNQVLYTQPPLFPALGEVLIVESSARSRYKGVTFSMRKFLGGGWGWLSRWQINAHYTLSDDKDDDSSENHLSFRPFNRFDYNWDYAASDRDIRHRLDLFATGRITRPGRPWILPDILTLRYQHRTSQPASFNPFNQKALGDPCTPTNWATRVVSGTDCGRNRFRIGNRFSSFDWGLRWRVQGFETKIFKTGPIDALDSIVINFEMLNTFNSKNFRRRQDLLQVPFLLEDIKQKRGLRVSIVFLLSGFGRKAQ